MLLHLDPHSGVPLYRQIVEQVRAQILSGALSAEAQLTPVRDLAQELKLNPMTVSKAYSQLEQQGLLERRRGIGLFVANGDGRTRSAAKRALVGRAMKDAAQRAVQLGVGRKEAQALFREAYDEARRGEDGDDDDGS